MDRAEIFSALKTRFRSFSLRTQLLSILLFLLVVSISALTVIYTRTEDMLIDKVTDNFEDITKAIQISVEEMTYRGDSTERLKNYVDMLNRKGINEISILNDTSEVIASSNPQKIGTTAKISKKKDFIITAKLGEESAKEPQRLYNIIMPVAIKGQNVGYIHISMLLDDYRKLQTRNHWKRILITIFVFSLGMVVSLILAEKYTDPIKKIATASKKIAQGELVKISVKERKDEIGVLVGSFNEMVDKLAERQMLEEKLKRTEQLSIIGQLSSGIAHEIRNPLNFLLLSIGHVKEKIAGTEMKDKEDLIQLLNSSISEIHRVNELIHNFLLLGRPIVLRKEWVFPRMLIDEALYVLKDRLRPGITINVACADDGYRMYCDREYIRICILNLLLNAVQAIEGTGTVSVECDREDNGASITVQDTGPGIPADDLARIFEPYFSTKTFGFGLGLSITKRFVEEHGGTISIESEAGCGTTMKIRIPQDET
jgi:signal transduction histidine kinase